MKASIRNVMVILACVAIVFSGCNKDSSTENSDQAISESSSQQEDSPLNNSQEGSSGQTRGVIEVDAYNLDSLDMVKGEVYSLLAFITDYDLEARTLEANLVEWITTQERADEVGLDYENDMPGGFYIYDEKVTEETLPLSSDVVFFMLNESSPMEVGGSAVWEFLDYMKIEGFNYPFEIRILNGEITRIEQVYLP